MSIWCSWEAIGHDDDDPPVGDVRSYAAGWSNHYPTTDIERPAMVALASIPVWCVPGHTEENDDEIGEWLRLDVHSPNAQTWWVKDDAGKPTAEPTNASVVMDETAVRALRDQLTRWLRMPKVKAAPDA